MYTPSEKNALQIFVLTEVHKFHTFERISRVPFMQSLLLYNSK
jgi:hypothetical protein